MIILTDISILGSGSQKKFSTLKHDGALYTIINSHLATCTTRLKFGFQIFVNTRIGVIKFKTDDIRITECPFKSVFLSVSYYPLLYGYGYDDDDDYNDEVDDDDDDDDDDEDDMMMTMMTMKTMMTMMTMVTMMTTMTTRRRR